jgi:hypothetical protein
MPFADVRIARKRTVRCSIVEDHMLAEVTQEPSRSSPRKAGQLPLGFCTRTRNSRASRASSESSDPIARVAKHVDSRDACTDDRSAAHPPAGSCLRLNSANTLLRTTPSLFIAALLMRTVPLSKVISLGRATLVERHVIALRRCAEICNQSKCDQ